MVLPLALNRYGFYLAYTKCAPWFKKRKHLPMSATPPSATALRVATLSQSGPTVFSVRPDPAVLARLVGALEVEGLRKLAFTGDVRPLGDRDWQLTARLGATVTQLCVVTLEPVVTRLDVDVTRTFLRDYTPSDEAEIEMPEDDSVEPLGLWIDPALVMQEELALALPAYPRKDTGPSETVRVTEPGKEPMSDAQARPFAGLAALKDQMQDKDDT
jgi:uncharacterized metal-binding protein YceD (DUF177 family)